MSLVIKYPCEPFSFLFFYFNFIFLRYHWNVRMLMLNNTTQQLNKKQVSTLHLISHRSAVVLSLENGAYPKNVPRVFSHNNSILYNHLCVWILRKVFPLKMCACLCCLIKIGVLFKVCVRLCTFTKQYRTKQFKSQKQRRVQTREKQEQRAN